MPENTPGHLPGHENGFVESSGKLRMAERDRLRGHEISRVTWIGFWFNLLLSAFKIVAGFLGNSRAVVADGVHSLSDLVTDIAVLVGVRFWMAPPDKAHPYGYKRLETLVSLLIGLLLALAGLGIVWDAVSGMIHGREEGQVGSWLALCAALSSVMFKEWLFRWTLRKADELKSAAVRANAWDHRSDAISSAPIAVMVAISMWFPSLAFVDMLGALLVAGFILHAAWKICSESVHILVDGGADNVIMGRICEFCMRTQGLRGVHDVRTRFVGQGLQIDLHAAIDATLTVQQGHDIAQALEDSLYTGDATEYIGVEIFDVVVHIDPWYPLAPPPSTQSGGHNGQPQQR